MYSDNLLSKQYSVFKGLLENVNFADKPSEYAESMENLDVDKYYGQLTLRDGSQKKYSDTFTNILSAYEYKYPTTGETILLINDNGTLEWYKDGVKQTNLTLPAGATLEANFKNNFLGHDDYVLITTGNGETNYLLWYGYTQRLAADNNGLFNNSVVDAGTYRLLRSQMFPEQGNFNNIHSIIFLDDYYYFTIGNHYYSTVGISKYIEKRDENFRLVDRILLKEDIPDNSRISICTDNTYIYACYNDIILKIDKDDFSIVLETDTELGYTPISIASDYGDYIYITYYEGHIYKIDVSDLTTTANTSTTVTFPYVLIVPATGIYFYVSYYEANDHYLQKRLKADLSVNDTLDIDVIGSGSNYLLTYGIFIPNLVSDQTIYLLQRNPQVLYYKSNTIYEVNETDFTLTSSDTLDAKNLIYIDGDESFRIINGSGISDFSGDMEYPELINMEVIQHTGGSDLITGTYFYKYSIVDTDGQEYVSSEPVTTVLTGDGYKIRLSFSLMKTFVSGNANIYRIKFINVYRAFSDDMDALEPASDYRALHSIDINHYKWTDTNIHNDATTDYYYYEYIDEIPEESISTVTYTENSGISANTKPRYLNPKFLTWFESRLHAANFYCDGKSFPNRVVVSPLNSPASIAFYDEYAFGTIGDEILGITNAYGRSIVFKNYKNGIFYNGSLEHTGKVGISSERGYCKNGDYIYVANEFGIFKLIGHDENRISEPIKISWAALTDYSSICMFVAYEQDRLYISVPETKVFVHNYSYNTWVPYNEDAAFKQYFVNNTGQTICYKDDILGSAYEYIYTINLGKDGRTAAGTGGQQIPFSYSSALLKLTDRIGENVTLLELNRRSYWLIVGGEDVTLKVFSYNPTATGFNTLFEKAIIAPIDTYQANQTEYFDGAFGESFSWSLQGYATELKWNAIEFVFERIGRIYA